MRPSGWLYRGVWMASLCLMSWGRLLADEPTPAAVSPPGGSLVICGGGSLPSEIYEKFIDLAGGEQSRLVVISTASSTADTPDVEQYLERWRKLKLATLHVLHTRSRDVAETPEFWEPLTKATAVWFMGGTQGWVVDTYLDTQTARQIHAVFERGGVIGGTSAGAAIMSPLMIRRGHPVAETGRGFGFLPGTVIDQHFLKRDRLPRLLQVLSDNPHLVGVGIDEGTAIVVKGRQFRVIGESKVLTCLAPAGDQPAKVEALEPGAEFNLEDLYAVVRTRVPAATTAIVDVPQAAAR